MNIIDIIKNTISEFLNEEHEIVKLYHGSNKEFNDFDDSKISTGDGSDLLGKGYYLTNNIDVAGFYGKLSTKKEKISSYSQTGPLKSLIPQYQPGADKYADDNKKINTFLVDGNILNITDYILDDDFVDYIRESFKNNNYYGDESDRIFNQYYQFLKNNKTKIHDYRGELLYIINTAVANNQNIVNDIIQYIKNLGYDGVKYKSDTSFEPSNKGDSYNYVIYNKNVIKNLNSAT